MIELIALTRAIHILAGIVWVGTTVALAVILPMAARSEGQAGGRFIGMVTRRLGPMSGISALLTVLSGIYLFVTLHPHDDSASGLVLKAGALAAVLALGLGLLVARPAGMRLAQLCEQRSGEAPPSQDLVQQIAQFGRRAALSSKLVVALLTLAVLSMALFRYAQALG
jgi:uncharacterized membrane protein